MPNNPIDEFPVADEPRVMTNPSNTETAEIPVFSASDTSEMPIMFLESDNFDDDDEWRVQTPKKRLGMKIPTAVLIALLIAAGAFWGGAAVQRGQGSSASGAGAALARFRGLAGAGGAGTGGRTFGGGSTAATAGTLTEVDGSTLYITNSSGALVKVVLGSSTKISQTSTTKTSQLSLGDTVVVQGTTAKSGTVTATSVAATQPGASTSTGGGFAGGSSGGAAG